MNGKTSVVKHRFDIKLARSMFGAISFGMALTTSAFAFDPLLTHGAIPMSPAAPLFANTGSGVCVFDSMPTPLTLNEAIERALCNNPKTREAWAQVKIRAAEVGIGRAAYLPTVSAQWRGVRDETTTNVTNYPQYSSNYRNSVLRTESVTLNWVLYDFGGRAAALQNANSLLEAAQASQEAALDDAFGAVSKDFYSAQGARGAVDAQKEIVAAAQQTFDAAKARADKGVAPISDQLQAQTTLAQAQLDETKAEGELATAIGTLNGDMGMEPNTALAMPPVDAGVKPDAMFQETVDALIETAKASYPSIRAAQSQLDAAQAKVRQTRAEGLPKLQFVAEYSHNNQPTTLAVGIPQFPATGHEWYLGLQVTIPIFEGFVRNYQIREAHAQADYQHEVLREAQIKVASDVWSAYQTLQTATASLVSNEALIEISRKSYEVSGHRYEKGVGNILELLSGLQAYARARVSWIRAVNEWRSARLQLAAKIGRIPSR
ncbi:TolC family protein [Robbsia sp. KACC 23696]|uniref:TolC family protein n=1 Tax=Robbsia sp. KACC 23696 TaxID=3149231 RepID=UPI00325AD6D5